VKKQSQGIIIALNIYLKNDYLQIIFFPSHNLSSFPLCTFDSPNLYFGFWILMIITDEGQPRPKYIFNKCGTNIYFFYSTDVWSITITEFQTIKNNFLENKNFQNSSLYRLYPPDSVFVPFYLKIKKCLGKILSRSLFTENYDFWDYFIFDRFIKHQRLTLYIYILLQFSEFTKVNFWEFIFHPNVL